MKASQLTPRDDAHATESAVLDLIRAIATVVPSDPAEDELVEKLFARVVGVRNARPLQ